MKMLRMPSKKPPMARYTGVPKKIGTWRRQSGRCVRGEKGVWG